MISSMYRDAVSIEEAAHQVTSVVKVSRVVRVCAPVLRWEQLRDREADNVHHEPAVAPGSLAQRAGRDRTADSRHRLHWMECVVTDGEKRFGARNPHPQHAGAGANEIARHARQPLLP